ncbi:MAG: transposase, partial [Alphaproteobacteria bacterium]|nr:transposase [Alphaproteobacteria bacterium]
MPLSRRRKMTGRGPAGKAAVAGVRDRATGRVTARRVERTDAATLRGLVRDSVEPGATLYTDEAPVYRGRPEYAHEAVTHSVGEYVRGMAHTN